MVSRTLAPLFLMASMTMVAISAKPVEAQVPTAPLVDVVSIVVVSVDLVDGELIATADVTLDVAGRLVTRTVEIPLTVDNAECDILSLAVGPVDINLLGLVVELDDCDGGPVTIDIFAVGEEGALLGNLLCTVAGLLDDGIDLGDVLGELDAADLDLLTGAIQDALNAIFAELLDTGDVVSAHDHGAGQGQGQGRGQGQGQGSGQGQGQRDRCDILLLAIEEGIDLDLLGLNVVTSGICLDVYAERGSGNLLGNLLCTVTQLLDRNPGSAVQAQLRNLERLLDRLGL